MVVAQVPIASPYSIQSQSLIPVRISVSASASWASSSYCGEPTWRSEFWGNRRSRSGLIGKGNEELARERSRSGINWISRVGVKAKEFNFSEVLGGRGLKGGEKATNTEDGLKALFSEPGGSGTKKKKDNMEGRVEISGIDGFEKELSGLVGGFPGGEKGLGKFLEDYPPPAKKEKVTKATQEREKLLGVLSGPVTKPKTIVLPLFMPGMNVLVKEPRHPYYMYTGIVQRVTDGKAGVLFEGGNWDKLVTFKLTDLERNASGPPMTNPKSAVLLQQQEPVQRS